MKKLIIITGISGSGKSTVAAYLNKHLSSTLISLDTLKENIFDIIGFKNELQKNELKPLIYNIFILLLDECLKREDECVIVEFPFSASWKEKFESLVLKYGYDAITIKVKNRGFETIYENLKRRNEGNQRHPAHSLKRYIPHESIKYKSTNELDYDELKQDYITDKYTSFSIGKEIILTDFSYKNLIKEIDKK